MEFNADCGKTHVFLTLTVMLSYADCYLRFGPLPLGPFDPLALWAPFLVALGPFEPFHLGPFVSSVTKSYVLFWVRNWIPDVLGVGGRGLNS